MDLSPFTNISICIKHIVEPVDDSLVFTLKNVVKLLSARGHHLLIEPQSAHLLPEYNFEVVSLENIADKADLILVIGGDGSLLNTARATINKNVPILGLNRGRLGFLTDVGPEDLHSQLIPILEGKYQEELRSLLTVNVFRHRAPFAASLGLNDVVLHSGGVGRMIEFEVFIDAVYVFRQRADGIITATPTGSTAYALSSGGPILYPTLNAFVLVPMCAHTLSSRPIVIDKKSIIELKVAESNAISSKLSIDGQIHVDILPGDSITITQHDNELRLIHPIDHDFFSVLREKLGWSTDLTSNRWSSPLQEQSHAKPPANP